MSDMEEIPLSNVRRNTMNKYELINNLQDQIEVKKNKHYRKYKRLRTIKNILAVFTNILLASTMTSLYLSIESMYSIIPIIGSGLSSLNFIINMSVIGYNLDDKLARFHVSQAQYEELLRYIQYKMAKNNLSNDQIYQLISEINYKLDLIHDSSIE